MNRDTLIQQVKTEYANLASSESQQHFHQTTTGVTPEAYHEKLLSSVISEISKGTFDDFESGKEIMEAVANDKSLLSEWR